jgi:hypothetical protein
MKKLIIIGVLILSLLCIGLLSGCGTAEPYIFDLCDWEYHTPTWDTFVARYNTPQLIVDYMDRRFTYQKHKTAYSPCEMWRAEAGDCNDYSCLAEYVSQQNGYTAYDMYICFWENGEKLGHCNGIFPGVGWSDCYVWHPWTSYSNIVSIYINSRPNGILDYWTVTDNCQNVIASYNTGGKSAKDFVIPY